MDLYFIIFIFGVIYWAIGFMMGLKLMFWVIKKNKDKDEENGASLLRRKKEKIDLVDYIHDVIIDDAETAEEARQAIVDYSIRLKDDNNN